MKKILILSYDYRPKLGGVATCAFEFAKALNAQNEVEVTLLAPSMEGDLDFDQSYDFLVKRVVLSPTALFSIFKTTKFLFKEVNSNEYDMMVSMLWMPDGVAASFVNFARKLLGKKEIPYYVFAHGVEVLESTHTLKKRIRGLISPLKKIVFKGAAKIFSVSSFTAELLTKVCDVHPDKIKVIYNGVDPYFFKSESISPILKKRHSISTQKVFFTLTRLDDYKGVDYAIRAFSRVKAQGDDFIYLIGGIGNDFARLEKMIEDYGLGENVILCGKVPMEELVAYYNLADVFILLSRYDALTPNFEGFGLVFLEAASCGTPSLAGASGGIEDAVRDGETGLLVDPENVDKIAEKLIELIQNEDLLSHLSSGAKKWSRSAMTWDSMAQRALNCIERREKKCVE